MRRLRTRLRSAPPRPRVESPRRTEDWLLLTDADRALQHLDAALTRTSRWQGNAS